MHPARLLLSQVEGNVPPYKYATGPNVLTYGDLLQVTARLSRGRAPLILSVPVLTPRLSSYWVGHVLAVLVVTALSVTLLSVRQNKPLAVDA